VWASCRLKHPAREREKNLCAATAGALDIEIPPDGKLCDPHSDGCTGPHGASTGPITGRWNRATSDSTSPSNHPSPPRPLAPRGATLHEIKKPPTTRTRTWNISAPPPAIGGHSLYTWSRARRRRNSIFTCGLVWYRYIPTQPTSADGTTIGRVSCWGAPGAVGLYVCARA
jgi:hypothetical protein